MQKIYIVRAKISLFSTKLLTFFIINYITIWFKTLMVDTKFFERKQSKGVEASRSALKHLETCALRLLQYKSRPAERVSSVSDCTPQSKFRRAHLDATFFINQRAFSNDHKDHRTNFSTLDQRIRQSKRSK